ncbi:nucleotidyltransferase domain-containing protein [Candidatus Aquicultor secundus]|nr:nucleotidyltransferase domain-containing protein [Candidatus Aquicultor secundus]NCO65116.1 nucleotidyltransferase domain-containing protein [Solirubrobacter sp.]
MSAKKRSENITEKTVAALTGSLNKILAKYPVVSAYLFGSYAKGDIHLGSDIDIALYVRPHSILSLDEELTLGREIEELSGLAPIDVRVMNDMSLAIQGEILTRGILLFSVDEKERVSYETRTLALYLDYLPHIQYFRKEFLKSVADRGIL